MHEINNTGHGLTLGTHRDIGNTQHVIVKIVSAGNYAINCTMTGVVICADASLLESSE